MKLMSSSIGRKILMALSGLFLVVFLTQHFLINITSVFSENLFNTLSHFMGNNPIVQFNGLDTNNPSNLSFEWTTVDGNISSGSTDMNPTVDAGGIYSLEVFNALNGCTQNADVIVLADFDEPIADAGDNQDLNCVVSMINLDASGSDSGAEFSYLWTTTDGNILSGSSDVNPLVDGPGVYI
ncbi:MAG: hypothetical protein P8N64_02760, partial [Flavobacteriaceae bacterium]|nr:hypothetical protein [Flavobacteriaceae bacterium]